MSVLTLRCTDGSIECGCRFKYIPDEITMTYQNLAKAIGDAIDKEAAEHDGKFVTSERNQTIPTEKTYDFEDLMATFQELVGNLMTENQSNSLKITAIVEKYLGKNKKVSDCNPAQSEQISLIIEDMRELLNK